MACYGAAMYDIMQAVWKQIQETAVCSLYFNILGLVTIPMFKLL